MVLKRSREGTGVLSIQKLHTSANALSKVHRVASSSIELHRSQPARDGKDTLMARYLSLASGLPKTTTLTTANPSKFYKARAGHVSYP